MEKKISAIHLLRKYGILVGVGLVLWLAQDGIERAGIESSNGPIAQMQSKPLKLTKHGQCRMDCREISIAEVKAVLENGKVNLEKSRPLDRPCPSYAIEGITRDGQAVRVVFTNCDHEARVVTAIDLGEDHPCRCR